jgi:hypothetical protein
MMMERAMNRAAREVDEAVVQQSKDIGQLCAFLSGNPIRESRAVALFTLPWIPGCSWRHFRSRFDHPMGGTGRSCSVCAPGGGAAAGTPLDDQHGGYRDMATYKVPAMPCERVNLLSKVGSSLILLINIAS